MRGLQGALLWAVLGLAGQLGVEEAEAALKRQQAKRARGGNGSEPRESLVRGAERVNAVRENLQEDSGMIVRLTSDNPRDIGGSLFSQSLPDWVPFKFETEEELEARLKKRLLEIEARLSRDDLAQRQREP
jgi:hypothetical protein